MSQNITEKIKITGTLVAQVPVAVGGMGAGDAVDLDVAVDGKGRFYIPGSSLAGPMRAWAEANLWVNEEGDIKEHIRKFFGSEDERNGRASLLFVEDGPFENTHSDGLRERRHGVSIGHDTGVAEDGKFYTRALLPKGASFSLKMELDLLDDSHEKKIHPGILRQILEALTAGKIRFGACKTRGFGILCLKDLRIDRYDFENNGDLDRWLDGDQVLNHGIESLGNAVSIHSDTERGCTVTLTWQPASDIMVKMGRDGIESDMLPLVSRKGSGLVPVIPGSSLKGVLRAHARKILCTVFERGCDALQNDLFGSEQSAGRLHIDDVYCEMDRPLSPLEWNEENQEALNRIGQHRQHVGIDRFTGGASDGALYSARPVKKLLKWDPIKITVDFSRPLKIQDKTTKEENFMPISQSMKNVELALLKLLIRDMQEGYVAIGFGTRRGLGEIEICDSVEWRPALEDVNLHSAWKIFIESGGEFTEGGISNA